MRNNTLSSEGRQFIQFSISEATETAADYAHDIDTSNTDHGLPIYYTYGQEDTVLFNNTNLTSNYSIIVCADCDNVTINNISITNDCLYLPSTTNTTVSNSIIRGNDSYGILVWGSENNFFNNIININANSEWTNGVSITGNKNNISNNLINSTYSRSPLRVYGDGNYYAHNTITKTGALFNGLFEMLNSDNSTFYNNTIYMTDATTKGIIINAITNSSFSRNYIEINGTNVIGFQFNVDGANNNNFENNIFKSYGGGSAIRYAQDAEGNNFTNTIIDTDTGYDILIGSNLDLGTNRFYNTTINESKISAGTGITGSLEFYEYIDVNVTREIGGMISAANATVYNNLYAITDSALTDGVTLPGFTILTHNVSISENVSYNNHTININYSSIVENKSYNITGYMLINFSLDTSPSTPTLVLNSTTGTNVTTDNLTIHISGIVDPDGDNFTNITDWRMNGTSVAVLNMPFDTNISSTDTNAIRDYSVHQNNGTLGVSTSTPTWNNSCIVGGCYNFDGGDNITISDNPSLDLKTAGTIEVWFKTNVDDVTDLNAFIINGDNQQAARWMIYVDDNNDKLTGTFRDSNDDIISGASLIGTNDVADQQWHHAAVTYDGTEIKLYEDGVKVANASDPGKTIANITGTILIGQHGTTTGYGFNGLIDEFKAWNRSLTAEQINASYQAGLAGTHLEKIVSNETKKGDNWTVAVTPNDVYSDGDTTISNDLIIVNKAPSIPTGLTLTNPIKVGYTLTASGSGSTDDDGDSIIYYYQFYNTNDTSELQAYSTTATYVVVVGDAHDNIRVRTKTYDGSSYSSEYEANRSVSNTQPETPTDLSITNPVYVGNVLQANSSGSSDNDSDTLTHYYEYYNINDTSTVQAYSTSNNYTVQTSDAHNIIRIRTKAGDGLINTTAYEENKTINNSVPEVKEARISPTTAYTNNTLIGYCNSTDNDTDNITYYYLWYRNGVANETGSLGSFTEGEEKNVKNISSSLTSKGETWLIECKTNDGFKNSTPVNSSLLTIQNLLPTITSATLNSTLGNNLTSENLTVYFNGVSDTDGDAITNITDWRVEGTSIAVLNLAFDSNVTSTDNNAVRDYSTNQNNGTLGAGTSSDVPGWNNSCQIGGCYEFDGENDDINHGDIEDMGTNDWTLEAWIKTPDNGNNMTIINKRQNTASDDGYSLEVKDTGHIRLILGGDTAPTYILNGTTNIIDNTWHNIIGVYNRNENMTIYIDGTKDGSLDISTEDEYDIQTAHTLRIGSGNNGAEQYFNGSIDEIKIYNKSLTPEQINASYQAGLAGYQVKTIVNNETSKGENWSVAVTANDGIFDSTTVISNEMIISNTNMTIELSTPANNTVLQQWTNRTPTFTWDGVDPDAEQLNYTLWVSEDNSFSTINQTVNISDDENHTSSELELDKEYWWIVEAYDGTVRINSTPFNFTLESYESINLTTATINFSAVDIGEENDTTNDNPAPLIIENVGNVFVNLTINSTALWSDTIAAPMNSTYYKFKAANVTTEPGSFIGATSQVSWKNMTLALTNLIKELSYLDVNDSAEIDIYIKAPPNELAGDKISTITVST